MLGAEHSELDKSFEGQPNVLNQYVEDVLDFTSQYGSAGSISYTAHNIIGKPRIYPEYGDFPQAFIMRTYGQWWDGAPSGTRDICPQNFGPIRSQDYIDLQFEHKVYPTAVVIYETYNPGAVVRIWASNGQSKWIVLWQGLPSSTKPESRMFSPPIKTPPFPTNLLRVEFDHRHLRYHTELDAVLLTGRLESSYDLLPTGELTRRVLSLNLHCLPPTVPAFSTHEEKRDVISDDGPFNMLPDELLLQVLSWLDQRSLCRCAQVSQRFKFAAYDTGFYTELNLKAYWWLTGQQCLTFLSSRCSRLQALDLSWCGLGKPGFAQHFIKFIEKCGRNLKILRLNNCKFISSECLQAIAKYCPMLEDLSARCVNVSTGWDALCPLKHLRRLDLYHCPVEGRELLALIPHFSQLRHLGLGATMLGHHLDDIATLLPSKCPQLCSLDLWKARSLSTTGVNSLAQLRHLQELDIGWCCNSEILGDSLRALALGCPQLRKLFLSALRGVAERELLLIAEKCPFLEQLDLLGSRGVTPDICLWILGRCRYLRLLDVSYCEHITEGHVQQWQPLFPWITIHCGGH